MNAGSIWWSQIGNSLKLLSGIVSSLRDYRSVILQIPAEFPWRQDFYTAVDDRRTGFGSQRRMMHLRWEPGMEPGKFVMDECCSARVRANYWPGQTYAEYLGSQKDLVLCDYYVWVSGVHDRGELAKWAEFISQYHRSAQTLEDHAVFIIEYDGTPVDVAGVERINYRVEEYDCRVFCLEAAAALGNTVLRDYQAELALCIGGGDPELCAALLQTGDKLLHDPVKTAAQAISAACASDGRVFSNLREQQITSAAWKAAIVLLFPTLEQYRMDFVTRYETQLSRHLPISNSNGDRVTDPYDLEIGALSYIVSSADRDFTPAEAEKIRLCRRVRNLLAHNKPIPYGDVVKVVKL